MQEAIGHSQLASIRRTVLQELSDSIQEAKSNRSPIEMKDIYVCETDI